ncbi:protein O-mannosyl-transferase TMTC4-like isoform X2 [Dysidea avara]|uniref:protein O-mannosyl-transferase TMTC4-like isoform X2 n=1 Tax=Dysidea avara TaxID=196820 RepID=UPI0033175FB5
MPENQNHYNCKQVANVVGRAEMLCAIWYLLALMVFMHLTTLKDAGFLFWFYSFVVILFSVVAMLCKEQGITVLGVCAAYDICTKLNFKTIQQMLTTWKTKRPLSLLLTRLLVLAVSTVVILYLRVVVIGQGSPQFVESDNPASFSNSTQTRLFTYSYVNAYNIWLLLYPYPLCYDWSMGSIPLVEDISDIRNAITLTAALTTVILLIYAATGYGVGTQDNDPSSHIMKPTMHYSRKAHLLFSLAMLLLPFVPASNLLFPVGFVIAERILYLPSMGYCLLIALGFNAFKTLQRSTIKIWRFNLTLPAATAVYFVLIMFSIKTVVRNTDWWDTEYLAQAGMKTNPLNAKMFMTMGNVLAQKGQRRCEVYYREALHLRPHYIAAWNNLGLVLLNMNRSSEAEECYKKALTLKPDHVDTNMNMGHMLRLQGRWEEAREKYQVLLKRRPSFAIIRHHLGYVNEQLMLYKEAEGEYKKVLVSAPRHADTHIALARLLSSTDGIKKSDLSMNSQKRLKKAQEHYEVGLQYRPNDSQARTNLIKLLIHLRKLDEAGKQLAYQATMSPSDSAHGMYQLGQVFKQAGNTRKAIAWYKEALRLNPSLTSVASQIKELEQLENN